MKATARSAVDSQIVTSRSGPLPGPISTNRADNLAWRHFMVPPRSNDSKADMAITSKPCGLHCKVPRLELALLARPKGASSLPGKEVRSVYLLAMTIYGVA